MRWIPPLRPRARQAFLYDLAGSVLFGLFTGIVVPFLPVVARRIGASPLQVSLVVAAPAVGLVLTAWWSVLVAGRNPIHFIAWLGALARGLFLLTPFVPSPAAFAVLVLGFHVLNGVTVPAYATVVRLLFPAEFRGTLLGLVRTGLSGAAILGSLLAGPALQWVGHRIVFPTASLLGIASALVYIRIRPPRSYAFVQRPSFREAWRVAWADVRFRRVLVISTVFGFGGWTMATGVPFLLVDVFGATNAQVGVLAAATSFASLLGFVGWGRLVDRSSGLHVLRTVFAASILPPLLYLLAPSPWFAVLAAAADGLFVAGVELAWMATVMELAPPDRVAHYAGAYTTLIGLRGLVAPPLAGFLAEAFGPRPVFLLAAAFIAGTGILGWRSLPTEGTGGVRPQEEGGDRQGEKGHDPSRTPSLTPQEPAWTHPERRDRTRCR